MDQIGLHIEMAREWDLYVRSLRAEQVKDRIRSIGKRNGCPKALKKPDRLHSLLGRCI